MAAALILLLVGSLLQGALCGEFKVSVPQTIEVLTGSCVTIPCSFEIEDTYESNLDNTCRAKWMTDASTAVFDSRYPQTSTINGELTGDLTKKDCTTTLNNMQPANIYTYIFRLECDIHLKYNFADKISISVKANPPRPTLTPSELKVMAGTSVSLTCSVPVPCLSHPPTLTWTPNLGDSVETLQENEDKTKVKTSVVTFTAYQRHHGKIISCTATYNKQDGSTKSDVSSLTADISCALCGTFKASVPKTIEVLKGSCVTIPCSFYVGVGFESHLDESCRVIWMNEQKTVVFDSRNPQTSTINGNLTGGLTQNDCTTTLNNMQPAYTNTYFFRLECDKGLRYSFDTDQISISVTDDPPRPTLTPSALKVKEGTSVSLTCSAPAPCLSHPPTLTWTSNLGDSVETLQENQDKTKVKTSAVTFTASQLHHGETISCTATYNKQAVNTSLTADISYSPKLITVSVHPSGPVPEGSDVTLTCSSTANPPVKNYTWYRADGAQETFIGTGAVLSMKASKDDRPFFCKTENDIGAGRSTNKQIDVQYPPKLITVSVHPSGPVPEGSHVTLRCSSTANPPVKNYTWYRADGAQETFIGAGAVLNIKASQDNSSFFCKTENSIGAGRSTNKQLDVQYSPKRTTVSVHPSGPVPEGINVTLTCSSTANPPVKNYTWYRADGAQETFIGAGAVLNIKASQDNSPFFCKTENSIGAGRSTNKQIDVQYSPKHTTVSVRPSGPVTEGSNVTLTCSSTANPPVKNYTWYRADGAQETFIGTGAVLNIKASHVNSSFFCKTENSIGAGRSTNKQIDIQYPPKLITVSVHPSGPVTEGSNVTLTCSSTANPPVKNYTWYRADGAKETFIGAGAVLNIKASQDDSSFFCKTENSIGVGRSTNKQLDVQYSPKHTTVSVHPSGPVTEGSNVTLTCSSTANPPVKNYTWYRADGAQETFIGTGAVLNIKASHVNSSFFCKTENSIGVGRSTNKQIDIQYPPKLITVSVHPSGPVTEGSNVTLTCSSTANPPVKNYTWYRADGAKETFIGAGAVLNIKASQDDSSFFCKTENSIGAGRSTNKQIDVQYSPKRTTVSVRPSGPVTEGSNVTLTCSSTANPPVKNYTWYRADGAQETFIGTGAVLNIKASHINSSFFCKTENSIGAGRSTNKQIDIQYPPKLITVSVHPSGPVPEGSNVTLTCSSTANPPVKTYTWYRADGAQETFIGAGAVLNIKAFQDDSSFFCKTENSIGVGRSTNKQIDVQYSPKRTTVSVHPSGPVPEGWNVTLTCSSTANPPVKNYTWYRADGGQETFVWTGAVLNIKVSKDDSPFFCKTENSFGFGRSNLSQIDVQFAPQILSSSDCIKAADQLNCSCTTVGNPSPTVLWYLDGSPVNHSDKFVTSNEHLNDTGLWSIITVNGPRERDLSTLLCRSSNSLGSATQRFCVNSLENVIDGVMLPVFITIVVALLVLVCVLLIVIRAQKTRHKRLKSQRTGDTGPVTMSHLLEGREGNEVPNTAEEDIYVNNDALTCADVAHPATISETNSTALPSCGPNNAEGASNRSEKTNDEGKDVIYSAVNWRSKSKKKKAEDSVDVHQPGSSYLQEEMCTVGGTLRGFVSNALEMGSIYDNLEPRNVQKEVESEYAQVKFKDKRAMHK